MPPSNLTRRRLLLTVGVSAGAMVAGCLGRGDPLGSPTATPPEDGGYCPTYDESVNQVVCYDASDSDTPQMYLDPSTTSISLPQAAIEFTLRNSRDETFNLNPYGWRLDKLVDGTWHFLQPWIVKQPLLMLASGKTYSWDVTVDNTNLTQPIEQESGAKDLTFSGLGPGSYAFGIDGWFESQDHEDKTAFITVFEVNGEPIELTPTDTIQETRRSGDTVNVIVEPSGARDRYTLVVTQADEPPDEPQHLITEQVMVVTPLRNALAHFESGVQQVRVETNGDLEFLFTGNTDKASGQWTMYVEYGGKVYRVERGPAETES